MQKLSGWVLGGALLVLACDTKPVAPARSQASLDLVLIHTADLHSHLFPEPTLIGHADAARGLGRYDEVASVGGFARVGALVEAVRRSAVRSLYLDSGDLIEGTAAYTAFGGEPEMRALSALSVDAVALGNHDLDPGVAEFVDKHRKFARFRVLAANYSAPGTALGRALATSVTLDAKGVRVGVIGVANPDSPRGLAQPDNPYGIALVPVTAAVQSAIDALRPSVDLIVAITHLGLDGDEALIRGTTGLDVVLGGHQHLALDDALDRYDCAPLLQSERGCHARRVVLVHSGALSRYVGRLDLSLAPAAQENSDGAADGLEVTSAKHSLLPVSADITEDAPLTALLEPYRARLVAAGFDTPIAFALGPVQRYGVTGGDSPLGNLVADAVRERAAADFAILNTTGIRADLPPGVLTKSAFVSALPFADTLTVIAVTGAELGALLDRQAELASRRGCDSPLQLSGFSLTITCRASASSGTAELPGSGGAPDPQAIYSLVTTDYLAGSGSGFESLSGQATRRELEVGPLDALLDAVSERPSCSQSALPCLDPGLLRDGRIRIERP